MRAILTYHSIDDSGSPVSLSAAAFEGHVRWLASGTVRVLSLDALLEQPAGADAVALTFDDGFANFAALAWPLLQPHQLPVTVFVVSDHVGGTNAWGGRDAAGIPTLPLMTWEALGRLAEQGVTLGAHTRRHPDLRRLDDAALADELDGSAGDIARHTGRRPDRFAYPFGQVDARVARAAADRFRLSCTTELRELAADDRPERLPRLDAWYLRKPGALERWGTPAFRRSIRLRAFARRAKAVFTGHAA